MMARTLKRTFFVATILACAGMGGCAYTHSIHRMAEKGDISGIRSHLEAGADINQLTRVNWVTGTSANLTPLHFAIMGDRLQAADYLLRHGADIEAPSADGTPLGFATALGLPELMELLLANGASLEAAAFEHESLLHVAIGSTSLLGPEQIRNVARSKERRAAAAKLLLDRGLAADARDRNGRTPLMRAAEWRNIPALEVFLAHGADINALDNRGENALSGVSDPRFERTEEQRREELETFNWLLARGADPARINREDRNLLHVSCHVEILRILLTKKLDVRLKDKDGQTPLHFAASQGGCGLPAVRLLVEAGAEPRARNRHGATPLHAALASTSDRERILYLLERTDPASRDDNGLSLLHVVVPERKQLWAVEPLLRRGVPVNAGDKYGCTPLHWAANGKSAEMVEALLKGGADPNIRNELGETPLHLAASAAGRSALHLNLLLKAGARPDIKDKAGFYPFQVAAYAYKNEAAAKRLAVPGIAGEPAPAGTRPAGVCGGSKWH